MIPPYSENPRLSPAVANVTFRLRVYWRAAGHLIFHRSMLSLILISILMSRVTKKLAALAVLFSLEFLSLGLFANGTSFWADQYIPRLLKAVSHTDARTVALGSRTKTDGGLVLGSYGEPTPESRVFSTATAKPGISIRSFVVSPLFLRITLAPKVSRFISKSVLIL